MKVIPKPVYFVGLLGLLPAIAGVVGSFNFSHLGEEINHFLYEFGLLFNALILSFLGGCIFIFEILLKPKLELKGIALSMAPTLWAIIAINSPISSFLLAIGFLAALERERILVRNLKLPAWWLKMRLQLTSLMVFALILMGFNE